MLARRDDDPVHTTQTCGNQSVDRVTPAENLRERKVNTAPLNKASHIIVTHQCDQNRPIVTGRGLVSFPSSCHESKDYSSGCEDRKAYSHTEQRSVDKGEIRIRVTPDNEGEIVEHDVMIVLGDSIE